MDFIDIPQNSVHCTDVLCENDSHRSDIDTHCKQLIDVLLRAGDETLPQCKSNATDFGIPFWNDEIDDVREVALFWHWLWIENGRPRLGHVADIMRRTRAKYHYTVRYTRKALLVFKSVKGLAPDYMCELFESVQMVSSRNTRSNARDDLYVPRARTQLFQSTLTISGANIWNKLSTAIRSCNSVADFKCAYMREICH